MDELREKMDFLNLPEVIASKVAKFLLKNFGNN